jgi:hypothetical protein
MGCPAELVVAVSESVLVADLRHRRSASSGWTEN